MKVEITRNGWLNQKEKPSKVITKDGPEPFKSFWTKIDEILGEPSDVLNDTDGKLKSKDSIQAVREAVATQIISTKTDGDIWFEKEVNLMKEVAQSTMPKRKPSESILDYLDRISNENI